MSEDIHKKLHRVIDKQLEVEKEVRKLEKELNMFRYEEQVLRKAILDRESDDDVSKLETTSETVKKIRGKVRRKIVKVVEAAGKPIAIYGVMKAMGLWVDKSEDEEIFKKNYENTRVGLDRASKAGFIVKVSDGIYCGLNYSLYREV